MWRKLRARLTYANVASSIALFVALSTGAAYAANTVFSTDIVNGEVKTADLDGSAVTTGKIANGAVTTAKVAADSVTTGKVSNGTLLGVDLADGTVTGLEITDGTVQAVDLETGAVTSDQVLDGTLQAADLADDAIVNAKVADGAISSAEVLDDTNAGGGLGPQDLATNSVGQAEIATDAVAATEIQDNSIDNGEVIDFGLSNEDVGVMFAEVASDGTLNNWGGGNITAGRVGAAGAGTYEVDFDRNIALCTAVATVGSAGTGTSLGEVNVADRSGNTQAVYVDTNNSNGTAADKAFRLVVVC